MNLFSDDFPYWFYLPEGCQKWNFRSGLYVLEKVEKPTFHQTLIFIPYHFHSRQELFSLEYVQFFKIKKHSENQTKVFLFIGQKEKFSNSVSLRIEKENIGLISITDLIPNLKHYLEK